MLKSCSLDPLPASVMKNCLDISLPVITKIVNSFLSSRTIPDAFKIAELLPALKKSDADFTNYSQTNSKRSLPSFTQELSTIPRSRTVTYGNRAFPITGPTLWNEPPVSLGKAAEIYSFRRQLKIRLFKKIYFC